MTSEVTEQANKNKEPEVQPQESNALKTAHTNSDTSLFDKEFNESDIKERNLIPSILSKNTTSNSLAVSPSNTNTRLAVGIQCHMGLGSEDELFKPSDKVLLVTRRFVNGYPALMLIDPCAGINHISEDFCKRAYIRTEPAPYRVQLANKSTENITVTRNKKI